MPQCPDCRRTFDTKALLNKHECKAPRSSLSNSDKLRRSRRSRMTPEEAQKARADQRRREAVKAERDRQRRLLTVEARKQELINKAPVTSETRSALDDIAYNLHHAYDWGNHADECVTAVIRKKNGKYVVFAQRFMTAMENYANRYYADKQIKFQPGGGSHLHAEMYAVLHYLLQQQDPAEYIAEIGVSKPICPLCQEVLDYLGIVYNEEWVSATSNRNWVNPWSRLSPDCKPPVKDFEHRDDSDEDGGDHVDHRGMQVETVS